MRETSVLFCGLSLTWQTTTTQELDLPIVFNHNKSICVMTKRPQFEAPVGQLVKKCKCNVEMTHSEWFDSLFSGLDCAYSSPRRMMEYLGRNENVLKNIATHAEEIRHNPNQLIQLSWLMIQLDDMLHFTPHSALEDCEEYYYNRDYTNGPLHGRIDATWFKCARVANSLGGISIELLLRWLVLLVKATKTVPDHPLVWDTVHPKMLLFYILVRAKPDCGLFASVMSLPDMFDPGFDKSRANRLPNDHSLTKYLFDDPAFPNQLCLYLIDHALEGRQEYGLYYKMLHTMVTHHAGRWTPNASVADTGYPNWIDSSKEIPVPTHNYWKNNHRDWRLRVHQYEDSTDRSDLVSSRWLLPGFMFPIIFLLKWITTESADCSSQKTAKYVCIEAVIIPVLELLLNHPEVDLSWDSNYFTRTLCLGSLKYAYHSPQLLQLICGRKDVDPLQHGRGCTEDPLDLECSTFFTKIPKRMQHDLRYDNTMYFSTLKIGTGRYSILNRDDITWIRDTSSDELHTLRIPCIVHARNSAWYMTDQPKDDLAVLIREKLIQLPKMREKLTLSAALLMNWFFAVYSIALTKENIVIASPAQLQLQSLPLLSQ